MGYEYKPKKDYYGDKRKIRDASENFAKLMGHESVHDALQKKWNREEKSPADGKDGQND